MADYEYAGWRRSTRRRVQQRHHDDDDEEEEEQEEEEEEEEHEFDEAYRAALRPFWAAQKQEVSQAGTDMAEYKNQQLPLARIKKIMKSDEDVRMISAEAPVLFAKACEMFILDLTLRGWVHAEDSRRRTLQRSDIAACIAHWEMLDFLSDIIPQEEAKPEGAEGEAGAPASSGAAAAAAPRSQQHGAVYGYGAQQPHQQQPAMGSPTAAMLDAPVPAAMYQQWQAEGQAQAAAAAAAAAAQARQ